MLDTHTCAHLVGFTIRPRLVSPSLHPRVHLSANHRTMKHSITALTMLLIQHTVSTLALTIPRSRCLNHSTGVNCNRYRNVAMFRVAIISLFRSLKARGLALYTGFPGGCRTLVSRCPLKRLKRPHDRYVIPRCSRSARIETARRHTITTRPSAKS